MALIRQPVAAPVPAHCLAGAVTLGNFDGVHLGHQALLDETVRQSRRVKGPALAVTFDPHPQQLLRPESFQPILTTLADRSELLHGFGLDHVLVLEIDPAFLRLTAADFFEQVVCRGLRARAIVEGFNFGFGRDRAGDTALLELLAVQSGIGVSLMPARELGGKPVSTSRIRAELLVGRVAAAAQMLGRPYRLCGAVGPGQKRGKMLGFPTANLAQIPTLIPGDGVYAVRAGHMDTTWPGAANVGPNPTFGEDARKVEIHLIGFTGELYGDTLTVDFVDRIRDTRAFSGAPELVEQLHKDVEAAKTLVRASSQPVAQARDCPC